MRYFLKLAYDGGAFHGWQRQPNASSVQQTIEEALSTVMRRPTPIVGAGRTDAGVHARCMYAHFDVDSPIADASSMLRGLNRLVGRAISLQELIEVAPDAHARFDAIERTYRYFVSYSKNPFMRDRSWHSPTRLDIEAMNRAAALLLDTEDFTSFAKLHTDNKTNICDVRHAEWTPSTDPYGCEGIVFEISADRFLRNMVRAVVGTLVDVGRHRLSHDGFAEIIRKQDRCSAGTSMPPQALFLWDVKYPQGML